MFTTYKVKGCEFRVYSEDVCGMDFVQARKDGFDSANSRILSGEFAGTEIAELYTAEIKKGRDCSILIKQ